VIWEAFKPGTEPTGLVNVIQGVANYGQDAGYGSIIPIGPANDTGQSGTMIIDSTGAGATPPATAAQDGQQVITGEPNDPQPNILPPGITPSGEEEQAPQQAEQPQQPALQAPAVGDAPAAPAQPAPPAAPATDSSGGIY
jgi:hypothetical protein